MYVRPPSPIDYTFTKEDGIFTWKNFFIGVDHILKVYESNPIRPFKKKAMLTAENWVLEHQEITGDWGGIQPAMLNSVLALHCLGYANNHPAVAKGLEALDNFCIESEDSLVLQSCISPVWDTALALKALVDSDVPNDHPALVKAAQWLLDKEIRKAGDWKVKSPELEPGGWAFEFLNDWYPDVDDSGFVMMALKDVAVKDRKSMDTAIKRGISWCLGMQSKNGGWGAFDKDNTKYLLNKIPFADLEALSTPPLSTLPDGCWSSWEHSLRQGLPTCSQGTGFHQEESGAGRQLVGTLGSKLHLRHLVRSVRLSAMGEDLNQPYIRKAINWLKSRQNIDGGWGETCESYHDSSLAGIGASTASQTGWALLALMAVGEENSGAVARGVQYLLATQKSDGTWMRTFIPAPVFQSSS